ncbi:PAP2 superfamily protein [Phycisphaerae bacterium RAS1]|nr:PAP2 superfamily protein [Phycisphaerae bacterium RAS1]
MLARSRLLFACVLLAVAGCPNFPANNTNDNNANDNGTPAVDQTKDAAAKSWILTWNRTAVDTSGLDHTALQPGENREFGHQLGPVRASRSMAIVHIAMFEVVNAIAGGYESYIGLPPASKDTSMPAAIAQAAHDTLVSQFPSHAPRLDQELEQFLAGIPSGDAKTDGIALGKAASVAILAMRENDGSDIPDVYDFSDDPGHWRVDPMNPGQRPLGPDWKHVRPFMMGTQAQFRCPAPPAMDSAEYAAAYDEVQRLGGDGVTTPTERTAEQTEIGIYWAYDGTPSLCAPPRLYNQIATQIAEKQGSDVVEIARLLALINVAMADAGIAIWESKYYYEFWRPVTGIRESDAGTGPTGLGDGNDATVGDPTFTPLGAPASNLSANNFTPPFPAYPSGHAGFGGALFETLREFYGTDDIAFTFVSDEFNGVTEDNEGNARPLKPRSFASFSQAEEENGQSRIYLGIHWSFDKTEGIAMGNHVGAYVFENMFQPVK